MEKVTNKPDLIRERLMPEMETLYDSAMAIYKKTHSKPETEIVEDQDGKIQLLKFVNVPKKVMSSIFDAIESMKAEGTVSCEYSLKYEIGKSEKENKYQFEIGTL